MTAARRPRGRLIALEGIDGAGNSTLTSALARSLRARGWSVTRRSEPADPRLGALAQRASVGDPWTGAVYFTVDRYLARPGLERDLRRYDMVLTDRSLYSTLAYQGSALPPRERRRLGELQRAATVPPDRVIYLDIDPLAALARLGRRGERRGPLERERTLRRVARGYRDLARGSGWIVLDALAPVPELVRQAIAGLRLGGAPPRRGRR